MKDQNQTEQDQQARDIFLRAVEIHLPEAQAAFVEGACQHDPSLRSRVDDLLENHRKDSFLESPAASVSTEEFAAGEGATLLAVAEKAGDRIGRYKLLQQIGEGGMGVVYMAEQEEPVRRRVALKIIKLGMDTRSVVARFEAERQALALMDHPNIAKVLDGGATDTGRPYFVMELVQGVPITDFCDKAKLSARERLKLFIQVCQAIQSAHQKGIIHRDIKPSNVLVTLHDGVPVPKVIDFGIAKATNQKLTEKTLFTNFATMIGTPAYMSPEQAEMSGLDIDTRTDIYALGVLLYALLTGTTPFPEKRLRSLGYGEMQRVIREEEPERPSTRLSTMANEQKTIVAKNCGEELASLSNLLKGDLDWIVMKCLEKDRRRRYETANGLASDIQRHLSNEAVIARPPSTAYRFQKMVRRNRTAALATAAVALTLIAALGFSTIAFVRERKARLVATAAERAREDARRATQAETVRADAVAKFATDFMEGVIPKLSHSGQDESISHLLDVAGSLVGELTNAPLASGRVRLGIGNAYIFRIGDMERAVTTYRDLERLASQLGSSGRPLFELAHPQRLLAELWLKRDNDSERELRQFGDNAVKANPPDLNGAAFAYAFRAEFAMYYGSRAEAEKLARQSLDYVTANPAPTSANWYVRLKALYILVQLATWRGADNVAQEAADEFFEALRSLYLADKGQRTNRCVEFLNDLWANDFSVFPAASASKALQKISSNDYPLHEMLRGLLGVAIARDGDWRAGLRTMQEVEADPLTFKLIWHAELPLAVLLGEPDLYRSLAVLVLARLSSGASPDDCGNLAQTLLTAPPEPALVPAIKILVEKSKQLLPELRPWRRVPVALLQYRTGHFTEALKSIEDDLSQTAARAKTQAPAVRALAFFLQSAIEKQLGNQDAAQKAYRHGLEFHSPALRQPGLPYRGEDFWDACLAEIMRREAASLLGDATPTAP